MGLQPKMIGRRDLNPAPVALSQPSMSRWWLYCWDSSHTKCYLALACSVHILPDMSWLSMLAVYSYHCIIDAVSCHALKTKFPVGKKNHLIPLLDCFIYESLESSQKRYLLAFTLMLLYSNEHFAVVNTKSSCSNTPAQKSSPSEFVNLTFIERKWVLGTSVTSGKSKAEWMSLAPGTVSQCPHPTVSSVVSPMLLQRLEALPDKGE